MLAVVQAVGPSGVGLQAQDVDRAGLGHAVAVVPAAVVGQHQAGGQGGAVVQCDVAGAHPVHLGQQVQARGLAHQGGAHRLDAHDLDVAAVARGGRTEAKQQLVVAAAADVAGLGRAVVDEQVEQRRALHHHGFVELDQQIDVFTSVQQPVGLGRGRYADHAGHFDHAQREGGLAAQAGQVGGGDVHKHGCAVVRGHTGDDACGADAQALGQVGGGVAQAVVGVDVGEVGADVELEHLAQQGLGGRQWGAEHGRFVDVEQPHGHGLGGAVARGVAEFELHGVAARVGLEIFGVGKAQVTVAAQLKGVGVGAADQAPAQAVHAGHAHVDAVGAVFCQVQLLGHGVLHLVDFFLCKFVGQGVDLRLAGAVGAFDHRIGRVAVGGLGLWVLQHRLGLVDALEVGRHRLGLQGLVHGFLGHGLLLLVDGGLGIGLALLGAGQLRLGRGFGGHGLGAGVVGQAGERLLGLRDAVLCGLCLFEVVGQRQGGDFFGCGFVSGQGELLGQFALGGVQPVLGLAERALGGLARAGAGAGGQAIERGLGAAQRGLGRCDQLGLQGLGLGGGVFGVGFVGVGLLQHVLGVLGFGQRGLGTAQLRLGSGFGGQRLVAGVVGQAGEGLLGLGDGVLRGLLLGLGLLIGLGGDLLGLGFVGRCQLHLVAAGLGAEQGTHGGGFVGGAGVVVSGLRRVDARHGLGQHVGGDFVGRGFVGQGGDRLVQRRLRQRQGGLVVVAATLGGLGLGQLLRLQQGAQ